MFDKSRRSLWKNFWTHSPQWTPVINSHENNSGNLNHASLMVASRQAMGTFFELRISAYTFQAVALAERCFDLLDDLEMQMTIYRSDSTISRMNQSYHNKPFQLPPSLFQLLKLGRLFHHETDGAYDLTTGALSRAWGFIQGPKRVPEHSELVSALKRTGMRHLLFDDEESSIFSHVEGVEVNLGSIGKGYAIDRVAEVIRNHPWPTSALIHGGRSSIFALRHQPGTMFDPWLVSLHNPVNSNEPLLEIKLIDRALGTSGGTFQFIEHEGKHFGHIIDPRNGFPPVGPLSVTVLAPSAAEADALSTAFYLTGPAVAQRLIRKNPLISAIFMRQNPLVSEPDLQILLMNVGRDAVKTHYENAFFLEKDQVVPMSWLVQDSFTDGLESL